MILSEGTFLELPIITRVYWRLFSKSNRYYIKTIFVRTMRLKQKQQQNSNNNNNNNNNKRSLLWISRKASKVTYASENKKTSLKVLFFR